MRVARLFPLSAVLLVGVAASCRDTATGDRARDLSFSPTGAVQKALASVTTGPSHLALESNRVRVTYHPGWSSRIRVTGPAGEREIYRQSRVYFGAYPREVVLGFGDAAIALFDPRHRIAGITIRTSDAQLWSFEENGDRCPTVCPPGTDSAVVLSRVLPTNHIAAARLALPPAERALASIANAGAQVTGEGNAQATYIPAWTRAVVRTSATGAVEPIYRASVSPNVRRPGETALGFRDAALAIFDPNLHIPTVLVRTLDGETWQFEAR